MNLFPHHNSNSQQVVGICLSGGGMRSIGHLGVLKALNEQGIIPNVMSGTSAGAIIACFYLLGYPIDSILDIATKLHVLRRSFVKIKDGGFFDMDAFKTIFAKHIGQLTFQDLPKPLYVAVTNFTSGKCEYFNTGLLNDALMASACIPLIFPPYKINNHHYVDGGVVNNLPIEPIKTNCDIVIGSHVNAINNLENNKLNFKHIIDRSYHIALNKSVYSKAQQCDLFIDPPGMTSFNMFNSKVAIDVFNHCYNYTKNILEV